jgi:hypothetical protein
MGRLPRRPAEGGEVLPTLPARLRRATVIGGREHRDDAVAGKLDDISATLDHRVHHAIDLLVHDRLARRFHPQSIS